MWKRLTALSEIVYDKIYIGHTVDDLAAELRDNTWRISFDDAERISLSMPMMAEFIDAVMANRRRQIMNANLPHGMIFYAWHEHQTGHLRFSLISDFHDRLPFGATVVGAELEDIIRAFLASSSTISWGDLEISDPSAGAYAEEPVTEYRVKVYQLKLP